MSGDAEQEYFSDGITEDIITDLSKVSALAVTSRNSAFVFKGKPVDVPKVVRELKVSHVLEGSVRKAGGRVRITAQLVDGASNDHVWAERYDRDLNDIFALQDEISQAIVNALKLKLLPDEKKAIEQRGTVNVEAYNLYLMARQLYVTGHEGDARRAEAIVRLCVRATEIDPGYARAWALMAFGQMTLRFVLGSGGDDGLVAAERALALDANLAEAHAVKARILADTGRQDEASAEIDVALELDPESYEVNRWAAYLSYRQNRLDDAIRYFEKATALMETDINSPAMLLSCYTPSAIPRARCARRDSPWRVGESTGAGSEQRHGAGLQRLRTRRARRSRTRQGADESRAADRSRQLEHALQLLLRADRPPERDRRRPRPARPGVRKGDDRHPQLRQDRSRPAGSATIRASRP